MKIFKKTGNLIVAFFGYLVSYPMAHPWDEAKKNQRHPWIGKYTKLVPVPWMGRMGNHHDPKSRCSVSRLSSMNIPIDLKKFYTSKSTEQGFWLGPWLCKLYRGDEILPSYMGIVISHI